MNKLEKSSVLNIAIACLSLIMAIVLQYCELQIIAENIYPDNENLISALTFIITFKWLFILMSGVYMTLFFMDAYKIEKRR